MRLFHFMRTEHAIESVIYSRLKVATLNDMNDPYEFFIRFNGSTRKNIEEIKNHFNKIVGYLCFSQDLGNPLQWAHYADKHRGVCMEFNVPDGLLLSVEYLASPRVICADNADWKSAFVSLTLCKYEHWMYEKECRVSVDLTSPSVVKDRDLYFVHFSDVISPCKVYTGIRCDLSENEADLFKEHKFPVINMTQDIDSYSIVCANSQNKCNA